MNFGPYRVLNTISNGQNSQIFEVIRDAENRRYALKAIMRDKMSRQEVSDMRHEFEVGTSLDHPNIIKMYEVNKHREVWYLVLELFRVPNLKTWVNQGIEKLHPLLPQVAEQAAKSLIHMASKGWVHRDVKPDNFLVSPEGELKLIDLAIAQKEKRGLAKLFSGKSKVQGTISYMSPEQIRGKTLDPKADVYSLGCTLFVLAYGKPPYTGVNVNELLNKHLKSAIPALEAHDKNVTPEFSGLVQQMLAKQPEDRPSMEDFYNQVRAIKLFKKEPQPQDA